MKQFQRVCLLAAVTLAHAGLFYAMLAGLLQLTPTPQTLPREVVARLIAPPAQKPEEPPPTPAPPPPPPLPEPPSPPKPRKPAERPVQKPIPAIPAPTPQAAQIPAPPASAAAGSPDPHASAAEPAVPMVPRAVTSGVEVLNLQQPEYPALSRRMGEEGTVLLRLVINERGLPDKVTVQKSSGYPRLDEAAREAVTRARFKPYLEGGKPVPVSVTWPIQFRLDS